MSAVGPSQVSVNRGDCTCGGASPGSVRPAHGLRQASGWVWCLLGLLGCSTCEAPDGLQVAEPFPHTRCLVDEPPPARTWRVGALELARAGRSLRIGGLAETVRIAAFSGPGPAPAPAASVMAALGEREPDLAIMLGGLGDDDATASETMQALGAAPFVTLFVPGGRDHWRRVRDLLAQQPDTIRDRFLEVATLRSIRLGDAELIPVAGADDGKYALNLDSCGFSLRDLQGLAGDLTAPSANRYLLAWQAPGRGGQRAVGRGIGGLDLGSGSLAELAARTATPGGLFAWPTVRVDEPVVDGGKQLAGPGEPAKDLRVVVPRLTGPALVRADGSRVPAGFDMLALDARGLAYLGRVEPTD